MCSPGYLQEEGLIVTSQTYIHESPNLKEYVEHTTADGIVPACVSMHVLFFQFIINTYLVINGCLLSGFMIHSFLHSLSLGKAWQPSSMSMWRPKQKVISLIWLKNHLVILALWLHSGNILLFLIRVLSWGPCSDDITVEKTGFYTQPNKVIICRFCYINSLKTVCYLLFSIYSNGSCLAGRSSSPLLLHNSSISVLRSLQNSPSVSAFQRCKSVISF